jgi:hypothetical protein
MSSHATAALIVPKRLGAIYGCVIVIIQCCYPRPDKAWMCREYAERSKALQNDKKAAIFVRR